MLTGPPIEVSRSFGALPPPPLSSKAATPGSSPPEPHQHEQLCPLGLDTMSGIDFQVAVPVSARPAAPIKAHATPAQQVSCEDSDTATAGQTAVPGQPKPRHVRFDSLVESEPSPQGVSLLDRSLTAPAHISMVPRHSLDSIQLDDALGMEDFSPAGTGRPKCKGTPRIKSRRSRSSKQRLPASLHTPLLPGVVPAAAHSSSSHQTRLGQSRSCSPDTAAAASTRLHRLKSGLSAGWQQLCKAGRRVWLLDRSCARSCSQHLACEQKSKHKACQLSTKQKKLGLLQSSPKGSWGARLFPAHPSLTKRFRHSPRASCCAGVCRNPSLCPCASQKGHAQTHAAF